MSQILKINMSGSNGPEVKEEPVGNYAGLGGRAMTSTIVAKEAPPLCHPLGERSPFSISFPGACFTHMAQLKLQRVVGSIVNLWG